MDSGYQGTLSQQRGYMQVGKANTRNMPLIDFFAFCRSVLSKQAMKIIYAFALKATFKLAITLLTYTLVFT